MWPGVFEWLVWSSIGNFVAWNLTWENLFILIWESEQFLKGKQSSSVGRLINRILIAFLCEVLGLLCSFMIQFIGRTRGVCLILLDRQLGSIWRKRTKKTHLSFVRQTIGESCGKFLVLKEWEHYIRVLSLVKHGYHNWEDSTPEFQPSWYVWVSS